MLRPVSKSSGVLLEGFREVLPLVCVPGTRSLLVPVPLLGVVDETRGVSGRATGKTIY